MTIARVSPQEAAEMIAAGGWVYVDLRPNDEFAAGHPPGALNVPFSHDERPFVAAVRAAIGTGRLVLGCKSGVVSAKAAEMLSGAGYEVVEQRAGFDGARGTFGELKEPGWARVGLPIVREDG